MALARTIFPLTAGMGRAPSAQSMDVQLYNLFHVPTPGGRSEMALCDILGSSVVASVAPATGVLGRGSWASSTGPNGAPAVYFVAGDTLFRRSSSTIVTVGRVAATAHRCSFAENQDQAGNVRGYVCDGRGVFSWDLKADNAAIAGTYTELTLPFVNGSESERAVAAYITYNTYRLIIACSNSQQWYYSELNSDEFKALNFESSESNPDDTIRAQSFGNNVWVFSRFSYDIFSYTGSATNPFDVASGATGRIGIASGDSLAVFGDSMYWLGLGEGSESAVYEASAGGAIKRISTIGVEAIISRWTARQEAIGFAFSMRGVRLYALTSQRDKVTLVYNATVGTWSQFGSGANGALTYWDASSVVTDFDGTLYFQPLDAAKLCQFTDASRIDYAGNPITRYWQGPVIIDALSRFTLVETCVDMETGRMFDTEEALIYGQFSWDGGSRFGERLLRPVGRIGEYGRRIVFPAQGSGYALVIRIGTSSNFPLVMFQLRLVTDVAGT